MEPNKLENQFREKFSNRKINPSEAAWDRLDAMLSVSENPKRRFTWLYIAACVVGFIFVGIFVLNQKENTIDSAKNNFVIGNKIQKDSSKTEQNSIPKDLKYSDKHLNQEGKTLVQTKKIIKPNIENQIPKPQEEVVEVIQPTNQIVVNEIAIQENRDDSLVIVENKSKSGIKKPSIKINSTVLLNQVDGELQLSFREKALNTITQKYKEAKEALVNRNNQ